MFRSVWRKYTTARMNRAERHPSREEKQTQTEGGTWAVRSGRPASRCSETIASVSLAACWDPSDSDFIASTRARACR